MVGGDPASAIAARVPATFVGQSLAFYVLNEPPLCADELAGSFAPRLPRSEQRGNTLPTVHVQHRAFVKPEGQRVLGFEIGGGGVGHCCRWRQAGLLPRQGAV